MDSIQHQLINTVKSLGYDASVDKATNIDDNLLIISGDPETASVWVYVDENITKMRINGLTPDFEMSTSDESTIREFLLNVFEGKVIRTTLPLYDNIKVGQGHHKWSGTSIDFAWPLGRKTFQTYKKK
jgi:hypothetical protein